VMEKGKWMFNLRNQTSHQESHVSKCQSLLNPRVNVKARSSVAILMKSKRDEVTTINIVQAQVEKLYFIFNLEYRLPLYQEEYHMTCQQCLKAQHSLKI
jgi:hypothetical protein